MDTSSYNPAQLKQIAAIMKRNAVSPAALDAAFSAGFVDDAFEVIGQRRFEGTKSDPNQRSVWRHGMGLSPKPKGAWYRVTYTPAKSFQKDGFAFIRRPVITQKALVYLFVPGDFGLLEKALPNDVVQCALQRGYEYCPAALTQELVKCKGTSTRRGYITAPIDPNMNSIIFIWENGRLQINASLTHIDPTKDVPWAVMMAVTQD